MQASDHIRSVLEYKFQSPDPWNDDILGWSKHKVSQRHRPKSPWRHRTLRTHWYGDSRLPHALTNLFLPSGFVISCTARQRWRSSQNRRRGTPVCFGWAGDTTTPPPFSFCPIVPGALVTTEEERGGGVPYRTGELMSQPVRLSAG
jgi:hypothetical protein